jgi:predicted O-methyltransferase YrrM
VALLKLAHGRRAVVELGTGTAWTAIALALEDPTRTLISYDPCVRIERDAYLDVAPAYVRSRIEFRAELDSAGPRAGDALVEMLFVDSQHEYDAVVAAFQAWRDALAPGAIVVFHDYGHPEYPGVRQAIEDLELRGSVNGGLFVWAAR